MCGELEVTRPTPLRPCARVASAHLQKKHTKSIKDPASKNSRMMLNALGL